MTPTGEMALCPRVLSLLASMYSPSLQASIWLSFLNLTDLLAVIEVNRASPACCLGLPAARSNLGTWIKTQKHRRQYTITLLDS